MAVTGTHAKREETGETGESGQTGQTGGAGESTEAGATVKGGVVEQRQAGSAAPVGQAVTNETVPQNVRDVRKSGPSVAHQGHHDHDDPHDDHPDHHTHRDVTGGWLRPAVFGAMDGLVSNLALITGVAGGAVAPHTVVLTGLAGLAAGAFSMAAGEYTSVASQRELVLAELDVERRELRRHPEDELAELAELYVARGVEPELAAEVARQLSADPEQALEIHAREELGVDPGDLPSPSLAAGSSFVSFAVGALLPVLPYLLGATALWPAVLLALAGLFLCGAVVARVTARAWWFGGLRQLVLGGAAAGVTYLLGNLFGAAVG